MTISKREKINELLQEIRKCKYCKPKPEHTPVVYSAEDPDILIVSEIPLGSAWTNDLGNAWKTSSGWIDNVAGTTKTLIEWLELSADEAAKRLFWIQRANCYYLDGRSRNKAFENCSEKYIKKAIRAVNPNLIIALGKSAAVWFFKRNHIYDMVGRKDKKDTTYLVDGKEYPCFALFHPSGISKSHRIKHKDKQERAKKRIKAIIQAPKS